MTVNTISILGINIKKIREEKGISAYKLAKDAKVGAATISEIETGKRQSLNSETIQKIAQVLEVSSNDLFATELETEYIVQDIREAINIVLESEELKFEDIELTKEEKNLILNSIELTLEAICERRKAQKHLEENIKKNLK